MSRSKRRTPIFPDKVPRNGMKGEKRTCNKRFRAITKERLNQDRDPPIDLNESVRKSYFIDEIGRDYCPNKLGTKEMYK